MPTKSITISAPGGPRLTVDISGEGTPVVLVHGLGLSRASWDRHVGALVSAGYKVIRHDQRGFGDSERPSAAYPFTELVRDLVAVADETCGRERFHLVGHSLGGMVAQGFALEQQSRLRSLALIATTSHNGKRASRFSEGLAQMATVGYERAASDPQLRARIEAILADGFAFGPPPFEMFKRGLEKPDAGSGYAWQCLSGFSLKDRLAEIRLPLFVLHGTLDTWIPFSCGRAIHEAVPGSAWHVFEGSGHFPHMKYAAEVIELLLGFWASAQA